MELLALPKVLSNFVGELAVAMEMDGGPTEVLLWLLLSKIDDVPQHWWSKVTTGPTVEALESTHHAIGGERGRARKDIPRAITTSPPPHTHLPAAAQRHAYSQDTNF